MHSSYSDIMSRIDTPPLWYDENGVPRYDVFTPHLCPDIYAQQVVLLQIECQDCKRPFTVEMHGDVFHALRHPHKLHYGDPPFHDCAGATMNCNDLAVLEVWVQSHNTPMKWQRRPDLEGPIDPDRGPFPDYDCPHFLVTEQPDGYLHCNTCSRIL